MLRIDLLLHTRDTAMILPTPRTLEPLKQIGQVLLTTAIALLILPKGPRSIHVDFDDARPQHIVAVRITTVIDTCMADYDIADVTPSVPEIVSCDWSGRGSVSIVVGNLGKVSK